MTKDIEKEFKRISKQISGAFMILAALFIFVLLKMFNMEGTIILKVILYFILILGCYSFFINSQTIADTAKGFKVKQSALGVGYKNGNSKKN